MALSPSQQAYYNKYWPLALNASKGTGIDARIIFAQSALESRWGTATPGNNFFGIKGPGGTFSTKEFINGVWQNVTASFAGYKDAADSFAGYVDFINKYKRYLPVKNAQGLSAQLSALQASGYATDPGYSKKLSGIIAMLPSNSGDGSPVSVSGILSNIPGGQEVASVAAKLSDATSALKSLGGGGSNGSGQSLLQTGGKLAIDAGRLATGDPTAFLSLGQDAMDIAGQAGGSLIDQIVAKIKEITQGIVDTIGKALAPWVERGAFGFLGFVLIVGAIMIFAAQSKTVQDAVKGAALAAV